MMSRDRAARAGAWVAIGLWLALYVWRAGVGYYSLSFNAYDGSVFDRALWSLEHGGRGVVPFLGHSIFSHHFMPILLLLAPLHALVTSPLLFIVMQPIVVAGAAALLRRLAIRQGLDPWIATGLMLVFLLARRTHGATVAPFYPEVFQSLLTFAIVLLWSSRPVWLWVCVILMLMTKEDAAIYVAAFAAFARWRGLGSNRLAWSVMGVAIAWFAIALLVAIPFSRAADGLGATNPLLEDRYGAAGGGLDAGVLAGRVASPQTASTIFNLVAAAGFLPLAAPAWVVPAVPGLLADLAAPPGTFQSRVTDHYAWPLLPWVFLSAAAGAVWLQGKSRKLTALLIVLLLAATIGDNTAIRRAGAASVDPQAALVRSQLARHHGVNVLAQANLIPHLPYDMHVLAAGGDVRATDPDLVLLTTVGNVWPMRRDEVEALIRQYRDDPRYVQTEAGPLFAFRRVNDVKK